MKIDSVVQPPYIPRGSGAFETTSAGTKEFCIGAATITPATANVFVTEQHVISCVLSDIPGKMTGVTWSPATETANEYNLADGSFSSNSQTSTLTISPSKLLTLDGESSGIHTFTCSFTVGTQSTAVTATQIITIFNPTASITQTTANVFVTEQHVISCDLSDIPQKMTGVTWSPATATPSEYILADGSFNSNSQTSTLTITASKLLTLDGESSGIHTFTCSFTVGTQSTAVTATQTITIFNPTASITQTTANVFVTEQHVISCDLSDIPEKMTGVTWLPATETANEYNLADGSFNSNSQTSTLTITASKLLTLDGESSGIHTFTCSFTVGTQSTAVTATQTITIFNPTATIAPATANVFVTEQHVIYCVLSDILQKMTGATWSPATATPSEYDLADGSFSSNSQTSALTITASKLLALHGQSNGIHTFTCSFTVGTQSTAVTATQTIKIFNPTASITQTTANVFVTEQHVISCDLSDIPEKMTGVTWLPATETANEYNLADGSFNSNSQTSTLTITASKLLTLDGESSGIHTFTCSFTVGTQSTAVTATQTITIFNPTVAIAISTAEGYSMDSHTITCDITDIPAQISVQWISGTNVASLGLSPQDGIISGTSQTSTLTLSSAQLVQLKTAGGSNPAHVFTCKITVGTSNTPLQSTQTYNIYTPVSNLIPASKDQFINADLESNDLIVTTDSILGSNDVVAVYIYDATSGTNFAAIKIKFEASQVTYHVGKCTASSTNDQFSTAPSTDVNKTWKFSKKSSSLEIHCNGQQVLNFLYSAGSQEGCATQWGLDAARIKFSGTEDTASDKYAIVPRTTIAYSVESHILSCTFYEILSQMTVEWELQTSVSDIGFLDISQGTIANKAQTSQLTLTSEQLVKLKAAGASDPAHLFTCKITVSPSNTVVKDILTSNIYTPTVSISPASVKEYSMNGHEINCVLADVPVSFTVEWTSVTTASGLGSLVIDQGTHSGLTQTSKLTLSKAQLVTLKATSATSKDHIFSCQIKVGTAQIPATAAQTLSIYTPAASITPATRKIYSTQNVAINCVMSELVAQTSVQWTVSTSVLNLGLNPSEGTLQGDTQTSTLPLSSTQLASLMATGGDNSNHIFTCKFLAGDDNTEFTATQTITISPPITYQIKVKISDNSGAGTTDSQYVKVKGTSGETDEAQCSGDFSSQNSEVTCSFTSDSNIGHYDCVSWRTGGTDSFSFSKIEVFINGVAQPNYLPDNANGYETLGSSETKEFCIGIATITPETENLYTMKNDHVITCALAHLREPAVGVSWTTNTKTNNVYSPQDGTHSATTFEQKSTLALSSAQLTALKVVSDTVVFTCKVKVGETTISATQTINLFTPSVEISPTSSTIYTVDTHTINCAIKEVLTQTNVEWTTTNTASITLNKNSGTLTAGKTQAASLSLSSADLVALKAAGDSNPETTYTCKITVGTGNTVFTATQALNIYTPAVSIATATATVYSVDSHSIDCVISDIPSQISGVVWTTATSVSSLGLAPQDGVISGTSQTSKLTLSPTQLGKLKIAGASNPAHVFTCKITVGTSNQVVTATQTVSIYTPVAAISPTSATLMSVDTHSINCVLSDLPSQYTGVQWISGTTVTDLALAPQDGTISGNTQTSTLSLSAAQLAKLKTAGGNNPSRVITCKIAVGKLNTPVTAIQTISVYTPAVAISTPSAVVYSMDPHTITCDITDIPAQITGVEWISQTNVASLGLSPQDGIISGTSQTSTLTLSSAQLVQLKTAGGSNPAHVFTCKITVGTSNTPLQSTQTINIYTPAAMIIPTTANVFTMDTHSINCVLSDLPAQVTGVQWTTSSNTGNVYSPQDGTISGTSQTSTLSLSSAQLANLKIAGDSSSFTCQIVVGLQKTAVSASQTITLFKPAAAISPAVVDLINGNSHTISCVFSDLQQALTSVQWTTSTTTNNVYTSSEGGLASKSQTSTLALSTSQISSLRAAGASHTFTCTTTLGASNTPIQAVQRINIAFRDCTLPSVDKISLLNGAALKHDNFISNLACDQSSKAGSPNLLIGGTKVTCNDGTLQYTGESAYEPRCLGSK
ncbi:hypothetical protein ACHWQZ_G001903 [Mnemiopsis leidyi]